jgi:uncharacterized membrane protein YtjA (UPF0391 family)
VRHVLQRAPPRTDCVSSAVAEHFRCRTSAHTRGAIMLHYAAVFFVIALVAAVFGFGGIAVGAASIAKVLFIVFLIGAVITFLMSLGRRA